MNILITGGCGYVGTLLTQRLLSEGYRVTVFDILWFGNFLAPHPNLRVFQGDTRATASVPLHGVDLIFHLANVANDPCSELDPKLSWEVNVLATLQLVDRAVREGVKQFIYASSGSVYGVKSELQVTEELTLVPISDYNKTKMVAERVLLSYQDRLILQCVRPATVCGYSPRMRFDLTVNMLTMQALANGRITVFGGEQYRPNIHIRDMVDTYIHLLKLGSKATGIYNAGFENISVMDVAKLVTKHIPAEIVVTPSNDPRCYRINSDKLLATGFKPRYGVEDAIRELVEKFKSGRLKNDDRCHNIKTMKQLQGM